MSAELKPCPFCGGRAEYKAGHFTGYVMCLKCEVMGPNLVENEAIAAWNTRAATPAQPTEVPPASWDEYALAEAKRLWELPAMPKTQMVACLQVALVDAMRFAQPTERAGELTDEALNTLCKMFHNGEEIESDDGIAMMVPIDLWNEANEALETLVGEDPEEAVFAAQRARDAQQGVVAWRDHVEQRIRTWRQRTMNKSGDRLAIDDFMGQDSIDDLVDFVCDEYAGRAPQSDAARDAWRDMVEKIVDVYADADLPHEHRVYVDGTFPQLMEEAKAMVAALSTTKEPT